MIIPMGVEVMERETIEIYPHRSGNIRVGVSSIGVRRMDIHGRGLHQNYRKRNAKEDTNRHISCPTYPGK